jgi:hypothetical protein
VSNLHDLKSGRVEDATDCQIVRMKDGASLSLCSFYVPKHAEILLENRYRLELDGGEVLIVPIERQVEAEPGRTRVLALVVDRQEKVQAA